MAWLGDFLHRYPDLAVYLAVGLGYLIGGYKIKGFGLGVSGTAKSILFLMFIFVGGLLGVVSASPSRSARSTSRSARAWARYFPAFSWGGCARSARSSAASPTGRFRS